MIDRNIYRKTEGILYKHYKKMSSLNSLYNSLTFIENSIRLIRKDIRECNIEINDNLRGITYDGVNVQNNNRISVVEQSLLDAIGKLERELSQATRKRSKTKYRIRELERKTRKLNELINNLSEEEIKICELMYGDKWSNRKIADMLFIGKSTVNRKKDRILEYLSRELNLL